MNRINIAIDGFSGCGKSTLARQLAAHLDYLFVDTGAMYRAVSYLILQNKNSQDRIQTVLDSNPEIAFEPISNNVLINGTNRESEIRSQIVADQVSEIAADVRVRDFLKQLQQNFIANKGVVMEGRDIATVIMPNAELKLFITTDIDTRVDRRYRQLVESGVAADKTAVRNNLESRDHADINRMIAPLKLADDAIVIDTTDMNREEQVRFCAALARPIISPDTYLGSLI